MVAAYLDDAVGAWFQNWRKEMVEWSWPEFVSNLCTQFGERTKIDVIEKFNKLKQKGTVEEYQVRFEELRSLLSLSHPSMDKAYFVSNFMSGVDDQICPMVKMLYPTSVGQVVERAHLHKWP